MKHTINEVKRLTGITVESHVSYFSGSQGYYVNGDLVHFYIADNAVEALFNATKNDPEVYKALTPIMDNPDNSKFVELWSLVEEESEVV